MNFTGILQFYSIIIICSGLAKQQILRRSTVSFDVLAGDNPPDYDSDVVKTSFMLGEAARLRFCIIIDTNEGDTRTEFGK